MTREEAIKTLRELWRETNDPWYEEVYNMGIEALNSVTESVNDAVKTEDDVIKRQDAIKAVCRTRCGDKAKGCPAHSCPVIEEFEALPSADAIEVVRCRDCKYWHSNTEFCDVWSYANVAQRTLNIDYCSRGERREDGE